jgi:hypothetical protein
MTSFKITSRIDAVTRIPERYLAADLPAPRAVKIELTSQCNYRCGFCAHRLRMKSRGEMDRAFYERVVAEKKVGQTVADAVQHSTNDVLSPERLKKFSESPERHALLRSVMGFYSRLTPQGLLHDLREEERRDRRRLRPPRSARRRGGPRPPRPCRPRCPGAKEADPYFQRNLALRQIPRPPEMPRTRSTWSAAPVGGAALVLKEAILALSRIHHDKSEAALVAYLRAFEGMAQSRTPRPTTPPRCGRCWTARLRPWPPTERAGRCWRVDHGSRRSRSWETRACGSWSWAATT